MLPGWFYSAKIIIPAPVEIVWRVVANPDSWPEINSLCEKVTRTSSSSVVAEGEQFIVEARPLDGPGLDITDWEVRAIQSQTSIHYRGTGRGKPETHERHVFYPEPAG